MNLSGWMDRLLSYNRSSSRTVSLLVKYIPSLLEKIAFNRLINLVARSILGPVTIHI